MLLLPLLLSMGSRHRWSSCEPTRRSTHRTLPGKLLLHHLRDVRAQDPTMGLSNLSIEEPSADDVRIIEERQLGHKMSNLVGVGIRCKHGYPQAFALEPRKRNSANGKAVFNSGLFRLSCPKLVQAVDEWEAEGAVKAINTELTQDDGSVQSVRAARFKRMAKSGLGASSAAALVKLLDEAHQGHALARHDIIGERLEKYREEASDSAAFEHILNSGIAGQTRSKLDLKCIHAQLADHLCRSASNGFAAELMRRLKEERDVAVHGDSLCCNQCNLAVPENEARKSWWYEPRKNKWKLWKRRRLRKDRIQAKASQSSMI